MSPSNLPLVDTVEVPRLRYGRSCLMRTFRSLLALGAGVAFCVWFVTLPSVHQSPWAGATLFPLGLGIAVIGAYYLPMLPVPSRRTLRRERDTLIGLPSHKEVRLPLGDHRVLVREWVDIRKHKRERYMIRRHFAVELLLEGRPKLTLHDKAVDAVRVRAFSEGLCRLVRASLEWRTHQTSGKTTVETRAADELDLPLVDRLNRGEPPMAADRAKFAKVFEFEQPDRQTTLARRAPITLNDLMLAIGLCIAIVSGFAGIFFAYEGWEKTELVTPLFLVGGFMLCVGVYLKRRFIVPEIEASPRGITTRTKFCGVPMRERYFDVADIESIYLVGHVTKTRVTVAGDGFYEPVGHKLHADEARHLRRLLYRRLMGRDPWETTAKQPEAVDGAIW